MTHPIALVNQKGYKTARLRFSATATNDHQPASSTARGLFAFPVVSSVASRSSFPGLLCGAFYSMKTLKTGLSALDTRRVGTLVPDSWRATKQSSTARGYGYAWQQARNGHLRNNPLCVMCQAQGVIALATVVDHSEPHRGDMAIFWDKSRWQSLCKHCHDSAKQRMESQGRGRSKTLGG